MIENLWVPDVIQGDCLDVMRGMETDSVDLVMCSPPYESARTYGIGFDLKGQQWVDWAVERYIECVRICRGLVAWVVEGQTRKFRYSATPALLMADLHRAGIKLRKPPIYKRVGIPGSGGPDWWRNDYEFVICSSKGKLPWSDNTAIGHPPKYGPGGAPSHRTKNGSRVNRTPSQTQRTNDAKGSNSYVPPAKANPGNVIECFLSIEGLADYGIYTGAGTEEILQDLRQAVSSQGLPIWLAGVYDRVWQAKLLQSNVQGNQSACSQSRQRSEGSKPEAGEKQVAACRVRDVREEKLPPGSASQRSRHVKQFYTESPGALRELPQSKAQESWLLSSRLRGTILREGVLLAALPAMEEIWRSFDKATQSSLASTEGSNVVSCVVGGGHMGSHISAANEAPFPEKLAEAFILSFCPPGGVVLDPFCGSGTTLAVANRHGRRSMGVDIRDSQVDLTQRRLRECDQVHQESICGEQ